MLGVHSVTQVAEIVEVLEESDEAMEESMEYMSNPVSLWSLWQAPLQPQSFEKVNGSFGAQFLVDNVIMAMFNH